MVTKYFILVSSATQPNHVQITELHKECVTEPQDIELFRHIDKINYKKEAMQFCSHSVLEDAIAILENNDMWN